MDGNLFEALKLMVIGMVTVFFVLLIVIWLGGLLIKFVNRFIPEEEPSKAKEAQQQAINPKVAQAIASAVATITGGKCSVEKIEKIK